MTFSPSFTTERTSNLLSLLLGVGDGPYFRDVRYAAFVAVAEACGTPALMAALTFGFFANCPISLTHYGNGCGPVYYGAGYVSQSECWRNGLVICTMNAAIWLTIGMVWFGGM